MEQSLISGAVHIGKPSGIVEQLHRQHIEARANLSNGGKLLEENKKLRASLATLAALAEENAKLKKQIDQLTAKSTALSCGVFETTSQGIIRQCSIYYQIPIEEMLSHRNQPSLVRARHTAAFLMKKLTGLSFPEIGRRLGKRDHTSIIYAVQKYTDLIKRDAALAAHIEEITRRIQLKKVPV